MYNPSESLPYALKATRSSLPLPRPLFFLTCASTIASFLLLVFSMLDLGVLSLWVNPPTALITMAYHASVLLVARRKRTEEEPSYFFTIIVLAYLLAVMWLIAFIFTVMIIASWKGNYRPESLHEQGLPVTIHTQQLQCFLTAFEFVAVGGIGLKGYLIARKEGVPEGWRPVFDSDKVCLDTWLVIIVLQYSQTLCYRAISPNVLELNDPTRLPRLHDSD